MEAKKKKKKHFGHAQVFSTGPFSMWTVDTSNHFVLRGHSRFDGVPRAVEISTGQMAVYFKLENTVLHCMFEERERKKRKEKRQGEKNKMLHIRTCRV